MPLSNLEIFDRANKAQGVIFIALGAYAIKDDHDLKRRLKDADAALREIMLGVNLSGEELQELANRAPRT